MVNMTFSTLLHAIIQKHLKTWEKYLPHVEFSFNSIIVECYTMYICKGENRHFTLQVSLTSLRLCI